MSKPDGVREPRLGLFGQRQEDPIVRIPGQGTRPLRKAKNILFRHTEDRVLIQFHSVVEIDDARFQCKNLAGEKLEVMVHAVAAIEEVVLEWNGRGWQRKTLPIPPPTDEELAAVVVR